MSITYFTRTEPRATSSDIAAGVAARIHDPAWMLGRQWQIGELLGEDAGTPISVALEAETAMLSQYRSGNTASAYDPLAAPLDVIVEAEAQRTRTAWTARMQIDAGRAFVRALHDAGLDAYIGAIRSAFPIQTASEALRAEDPAGARLIALAAGRIPDGAQLYAQLGAAIRQGDPLPAIDGVAPAASAGLRTAALAWQSWCDDTIAEETSPSAWQSDALDYSFSVATGAASDATTLDARDYRGGSLDWHAFDVRPDARTGAYTALPPQSVFPTAVRFRGMPNARWWEIEDASVDMGSVDGGPSDVARLAFLEFALVYGNDFFAVPLRLAIGSLTRIASLVVADTFGMRLAVRSANQRQGKQGAGRFSLFALSQRGPRERRDGPVADVLLLAPTANQVLASPPVEEVRLLRDEMANLAWAVERSYEGERGTAVERHESAVLTADPPPPPGRTAAVRYELGSTVPPYWFPLVSTLVGGDLQLGLERMTNQPAEVAPRGRFLDLDATVLPDTEVPREGARLIRDYAMTRWTNGRVFVWSRRLREVGRGEGSSGLRFDAVKPADA